MLAAALAPLSAQETSGDLTVAVLRDQLLSVTGGCFVANRATLTLVPLSNQGAELQILTAFAASPWESDRFFGVTDGRFNTGNPGLCVLHQLRAAGGNALGTVPLASLQQGFVNALCVVGDHVYFMGQQSIGRVSLANGAVEPVLAYGAGEGAFGLASDGRWLYAALTARDVYRVDLLDPSRRPRLASLGGAFISAIGALAWSRADTLLVGTSDPIFGVFLHELSPQSGAVLQSASLPLAAVRALAVDPLSGEILVSGTVQSRTGAVLALGSVTAAPSLAAVPPAESTIALRRSWPLHRRGPVCRTGDGREVAITGNVPPRRGTTWQLQLSTRPGHLALLSSSLRQPPGLGLFLPLDWFGAPGCVVTVAGLGTALVVTDAAGAAGVTFAIPNSAGMHDVAVDFQWLVLDHAANALGIATSQAGAAVVD